MYTLNLFCSQCEGKGCERRYPNAIINFCYECNGTGLVPPHVLIEELLKYINELSDKIDKLEKKRLCEHFDEPVSHCPYCKSFIDRKIK